MNILVFLAVVFTLLALRWPQDRLDSRFFILTVLAAAAFWALVID